jgi:toxin YoeB
MSYLIRPEKEFLEDVERHKKAGQKHIISKINILIGELRIHPRVGTGLPEQLGYDKKGQWSRRITQKHRLVYEIHDAIVTVILISAYGHYEDK